MYHVTIPGTFVEVELSENAPLFKEGFVLRKNIMEAPHKKGVLGGVCVRVCVCMCWGEGGGDLQVLLGVGLQCVCSLR